MPRHAGAPAQGHHEHHTRGGKPKPPTPRTSPTPERAWARSGVGAVGGVGPPWREREPFPSSKPLAHFASS